MKITQISVFLQNRKGALHGACSCLGRHGINILALNIAETDNFGVLRMVVDNPEEALKSLKEDGFVAATTDIVAVEVDDRPGGLAEVLEIINRNDINIEYMYGFVEKMTDRAMLVFRFENPDSAVDVLLKSNVKLVSRSALQEM